MLSKLKQRWIRTLLVLMVLATAGTMTGYFLWNKPHRDVAGTDAINIQAADLYHIFTSDTAVAKTKYLQQVLVVQGALKAVTTNQQQQVVATLLTGTEGASINCTFEGPARELQAGARVKIKGICSGLGEGDAELGIPGDLYLVRCYIAE